MSIDTIVLAGNACVGKGTQAKKYSINHSERAKHYSSGDVLRGLDKVLYRDVHETISEGHLVEDNLMLELYNDHILSEIETGKFDPTKQILLADGIPRTKNQAMKFENSPFTYNVLGVIVFYAPNAISLERNEIRLKKAEEEKAKLVFAGNFDLKTQIVRADDRREIAERRIKTYPEVMAEMLKMYNPELTLAVDANQTIEKVYLQTERAINMILSNYETKKKMLIS